MVITYYGKQFFKVVLGDLVLAIDPIGKDSKEKASRFGADITFSSFNHPDFNGIDQTSFGGKEPYVIAGPGEYEIKGVFIKGFQGKTSYGGKDLPSSIYLIRLEDINILYLGPLVEAELPTAVKEELDEVDVLFLPIGGKGVLSASEASKLATKLEAKLVIPMNYDDADLKVFLKEEGEAGVKAVEKLVLKKKDLAEKDGEIVVLKQDS